ncbi:MAG: cellulase family glycosylhydrolase [Solirubrobacteraceae bacterium]|nr:cellulase family glycosylhydrolase [Solirubrobacteraceae bacterium]
MPQSVLHPVRRPARTVAHLLVLLAVAVGAAVALAPSSAHAMAKGLMDENMPRNGDDATRLEFYTVAAESNVKFLRTFVHWDGKHDFAFPHEIESIRRMANEAPHIQIDTLFVGWNGELGRRYKDARRVPLNRYRKMVRQTVKALQDVPIRIIWSPWNEANYQTQLPKKHGPEVWRKMQNIAYDEIKKIDPDALVVAGELAPYARNKRTSTDPGLWLRRGLGLNAAWKPLRGTKRKDYEVKADAITLHSYDYKNDPAKRLSSKYEWTIRNLSKTRSILKKIGRTKRIRARAVERLYITEFGYIFKGSQAISEEQAATWLERSWNIAKRNKIRGMLWFQVRDPERVFFSGLRTAEGVDRAVLPVFRTLE